MEQESSFGELLKHFRKSYDWTQAEVADRFGYSEETIKSWEQGRRFPAREEVSRLAELMELDAQEVKDAIRVGRMIVRSRKLTPGTVSLPTSQEAINLPLVASERCPEELSGTWLALWASDPALLFQERWSIKDILTSLQVVLKGVQVLSNLSRRALLQLGTAALLSGIPLPEGRHISAEERIELHRTFGESIAAGWQLFHTAGNAQVLVVGQTQLLLIQQAHAYLFPQVRAMFYTGVYNLIGRARHLQEHYDEALQAHMSAHIAALGAGDPLHVAQSLICLADTYQALGRYPEAIQSVEEALRTVGSSDEEHVRTRAHLLGCWADYAMTLEDYEQAERKLDKAFPYIELLTTKEEFDRASRLQLAGKCALMKGDYYQATDHLEEALAANPPHWLVRQAGILIPLAITYARRRERDVSLRVARQALPVLSALNAPMTNMQFADFLRQDLLGLFPHDRHIRTFVTETQHEFPQLAPVI